MAGRSWQTESCLEEGWDESAGRCLLKGKFLNPLWLGRSEEILRRIPQEEILSRNQ